MVIAHLRMGVARARAEDRVRLALECYTKKKVDVYHMDCEPGFFEIWLTCKVVTGVFAE